MNQICPPVFENVSIKHLFATPFIVAELPHDVSREINPQIKQLVLQKSVEQSGEIFSNDGGWQSDNQLPTWGGLPILLLLSAMKHMLKDITLYAENGELKRGNIDWKVNGWANINRKGNKNLLHTHPGAFWSAVYYVAVDDADRQMHRGGEIEFSDPRGPLPLMYNPYLHFGIQGYLTAGKVELHSPRAGTCIFFPSWVAHAVRPHANDDVRISLAFNFST